MVFFHRQVVLKPLPVVVILAVVELPLLVVHVPLAVVINGLRVKGRVRKNQDSAFALLAIEPVSGGKVATNLDLDLDSSSARRSACF